MPLRGALQGLLLPLKEQGEPGRAPLQLPHDRVHLGGRAWRQIEGNATVHAPGHLQRIGQVVTHLRRPFAQA